MRVKVCPGLKILSGGLREYKKGGRTYEIEDPSGGCIFDHHHRADPAVLCSGSRAEQLSDPVLSQRIWADGAGGPVLRQLPSDL